MSELSQDNIKNLHCAGIDRESAMEQLKYLKNKPAEIQLLRTASIDDGILCYSKSEEQTFLDIWEEYLTKGKTIFHFIPASGSANRFFKDLDNFLKSPNVTPQTNFEKNFFKHIQSFAFYRELNNVCINKENKEISELLELGKFKLVVEYLLTEKGLNYRQLPPSLFKFHTDKSKTFTSISKYLPKKIVKYSSSWENTRTPIQESLIDCAMVSGVKGGTVNVCYSVLAHDRSLLQDFVREFKVPIEKKFGVSLYVTLPVQERSTNTMAMSKDGKIITDEKGNIVLHKSGHGALFPILSSIPADVVFIKNIDNESPDALKKTTVMYRKIMGGLLVKNYKQIKKFIRILDKTDVPDDQLIEIINYVENVLNVKRQKILSLPKEEQVKYLRSKLNRPLRVCAMVRNEDEQGGMPCWVKAPDGTSQLQIVEYYQVCENPEYLNMFSKSTHFNPVDMACCITDYKGKRFDLNQYADHEAWMVHNKEMEDGSIELRLDRPGLWNGCMADWNTIFFEVPIKTFNPVKTINDLLRQEHQN